MAEVKDKVVTVESLSVLHEHSKESYVTKVDPTGSGSLSINRKADTTVGDYSVAVGYNTEASAYGAYAEGIYTKATGEGSHAEGGYDLDAADPDNPEATTAAGEFSHAEGAGCYASDIASHAEGILTNATNSGSHAEGYGTVASGNSSHTEGYYTIASGQYSHAEGCITIASSKHQHVQGKYNIEDTENKYAHIVGNGTSKTARSNAHTLDWDGNAWFAGYVEAPYFILKSSTENSAKRFKITVDDSGKLTATEI